MTSSQKLGSRGDDVELKCLEPLLQQSLSNKELRIVDFSAKKLLPLGENYASIMVKLDVKVRRNKSAEEEMLHLVAKTPTCIERPTVEWPVVFLKELFMYNELRLLYRELEREVDIKENQLIDIWPEFVGYRNSLEDDSKIDDNSLMLMENINYKGFYILNRRAGLDIHCARKALTSLARYHVLGIVMVQKRTTFAKKAIAQASPLGLDFEKIDDGYDSVFKTFLETPLLQKYSAAVEPSFKQIKKGRTWKAEATVPWATITHGDFWVNNILFHKDDEGNVDDVKFVDFQLYLFSSPLKDLIFFLSSSLDRVAQMNHFDELVTHYYNAFIETLRRMRCDTLPFTRESFNCELKRQAINEFPFCALAIKFFDFEVDDQSKNSKQLVDHVIDANAGHGFINKLLRLLEIYTNMGWFHVQY